MHTLIRKNITRLMSDLNMLDDKAIKLVIVGELGNDITVLKNHLAMKLRCNF